MVNLQRIRSETPGQFRKEKPRTDSKQISDLVQKVAQLNAEKTELEILNTTLSEENRKLKENLSRAKSNLRKM